MFSRIGIEYTNETAQQRSGDLWQAVSGTADRNRAQGQAVEGVSVDSTLTLYMLFPPPVIVILGTILV